MNDTSQSETTDREMHEASVLNVLHRSRREGALWTSDIAHGSGLPTTLARRALQRLEAAGRVRRVVTGNPTSWELASHG